MSKPKNSRVRVASVTDKPFMAACPCWYFSPGYKMVWTGAASADLNDRRNWMMVLNA